MKMTTVLAVAIGVGALAACNQSREEQRADNIEAASENEADMIEEQAENEAEATREAGENTADAVREGADADGNSAD